MCLLLSQHPTASLLNAASIPLLPIHNQSTPFGSWLQALPIPHMFLLLTLLAFLMRHNPRDWQNTHTPLQRLDLTPQKSSKLELSQKAGKNQQVRVWKGGKHQKLEFSKKNKNESQEVRVRKKCQHFWKVREWT